MLRSISVLIRVNRIKMCVVPACYLMAPASRYALRFSPRVKMPTRPPPQARTWSVCRNWRKLMKGGDLNYDVVIASPDAMGVVGQLGQIARSARFDAESRRWARFLPTWRPRYKTPRPGRCVTVPTRVALFIAPSASRAFEVAQLRENLEFLLNDLKRAKPSIVQGYST